MQQGQMGGPVPQPHQPYPPAQIPTEPNAVTALVLGILGIVVCGIIAPFAWSIGKKSVDNIARNPNMYSGEGMAKAGHILGIIGTILLIIAVLFLIVYFVILGLIIGTGIGEMTALVPLDR